MPPSKPKSHFTFIVLLTSTLPAYLLRLSYLHKDNMFDSRPSSFKPGMHLGLFDSNARGGMKEEGRAMAMAVSCSASGDHPSLELGMAFSRNGQEAAPSSMMMKRSPVQLDLLPMHSASASASAAPLSSLTQTSYRHSVPCSSKVQYLDGATVVDINSSSRGASPRGIDMNQLPSSDYDDADVSSPNSILSPFHSVEASLLKPSSCAAGSKNATSPKRERESFTGFDQDAADRGFEATSRASDEEDGGMPRKKLRLSKDQSALLEESFKEHSTLNPKQKSALAKQLNLRPRQVEVWFQNRRARTKLKQTEVDCEILKRCCDSLTEENRRLQKELQELRAIKLPPPCILTPDFLMPFPAATLTMCPSCERVAPQLEYSHAARSTLLHQLPKPVPQVAGAPTAFAPFAKIAAAASTLS